MGILSSLITGIIQDSPSGFLQDATDSSSKGMDKTFFIGICRHRLLTDGEGVTTLVGFSGCPLRCKYCINKLCWEETGIISYTPAELYDIIKKDLIYLIATGGGITFGGGEPGLHSKFISEFRKICDERLHIYLETSLNIPLENLLELIPAVDSYIVDIKDVNNQIYLRYTGCNNRKAIRNLKYMVDNNLTERLTIRVPLIPEYNTEQDVENSIAELKALGITKFDRFTYRASDKKPKCPEEQNTSEEMNYGKAVCEVLKQIRIEIAAANNIPYTPHLCHHKQCLMGTCSVCEKELFKIETQLNNKMLAGDKIII